MMTYPPKTIPDIYEQFLKRREALIRALVDEQSLFYEQCDPEKDNLCLYGHEDGTWSVGLPAAEVPTELPEPVLGINFARNGMELKDWLALCAVHSDSWLMAILFFFGARFNYVGRAELFSLVNQHPTIYEVVTGRVSRDTVYKRQDINGPAMYAEQYRRVEEPPIRSRPSGRILQPNELTPALCGRKAELYWPDDGKWYLVEIQSIDMDSKMAMVRYATNEEEELNLLEVIEDNQMSLL